MENLLGRHALVTHFVSQLSGLHLPVLKQANGHVDNFDPLEEDFARRTWRVRLCQLVKDSDWPWVRFLLAQSRLTLEQVSYSIEAHLSFLRERKGTYISYYSSRFPDSLRQVSDPPGAVSCLGNIELLDYPCVAIVGSRNASRVSLEASQEIAMGLSAKGYVVVSGGAVGCDIAAHYGSYQAPVNEARTIIVFASGLALPYPKQNLSVFVKILNKGGMWLSERLFDQASLPYHFLVRNRLISGLSSMVVIMQAAEKSGAYGTACRALDQGREVMVFRQENDDIRSRGNELLIDDGAVSFGDIDEFFSNFNI